MAHNVTGGCVLTSCGRRRINIQQPRPEISNSDFKLALRRHRFNTGCSRPNQLSNIIMIFHVLTNPV